MYGGVEGGVNTVFVVGVGGDADADDAFISIIFLAAIAAGLAFRGGGGGNPEPCFVILGITGILIFGGETSWQGFIAFSVNAAMGSIVSSSGSASI